jgi:hypothetical protein
MRKFLETKKFFQKIFKKFQPLTPRIKSFQPLSPAERKKWKFSSRRRRQREKNENFPATAAADCLRVFLEPLLRDEKN